MTEPEIFEVYVNKTFIPDNDKKLDDSNQDSAFYMTEITTTSDITSSNIDNSSLKNYEETCIECISANNSRSGSLKQKIIVIKEEVKSEEEEEEENDTVAPLPNYSEVRAQQDIVQVRDGQNCPPLVQVKEKKDDDRENKEKTNEKKEDKNPAPKKPKKKRFDLQASINKRKQYTQLVFYKNNMSYFITIALYILIQVFFVLIQLLVIYPNLNVWLNFARGAGILIDFNACLIVLLVLRRLNTWLRNSVIGRRYLVLDESLNFHKAIGVWILILAFIHTIFHLVNLWYMSDEYYATLTKKAESRTIYKIILDYRTSFSDFSNKSGSVEYISNMTNLIKQTVTNTTTPVIIANLSTTTIYYPTTTSYGPYARLFFWTDSGFGYVGHSAVPTGWLLLITICVMEFFALPFIRRKGFFQLFYITHWLWIVFYILLILHAEVFWKWFIGPAVIVIIERLYTLFRVRSKKFGETYIKDVNLLSSKVTNLVITRPVDFKFKSGDYIFINIPKIAKYEWHPFTISSAPEIKDEINLHIRSLGNWTNKLHEYFTNISNYNKMFEGRNIAPRGKPEPSDKKGVRRQRQRARAEPIPEYQTKRKMSTLVVLTDYKKNDENKAHITDIQEKEEDAVVKPRHNSNKIEVNLNIANKIENIWMDISVDGPYGTASRGIFYSEHAVLIAGGIGVTPFASILQSLWFKYSNALKTCPDCAHQWYDRFEQKTLKKVDFIWVNRDYRAFEWFIELLGELELQQLQLEKDFRFLNIHLYMTSSKTEREIVLDTSQIAEFKMNKYRDNKDIPNANSALNGFSMKMNPGRPNLDKIFTRIEAENKGKVDVFFCGNTQFGSLVEKNCNAKKFKFYKEIF